MRDLVLLDANDGGDVAVGGARELALVEGGNPPSEYIMFGPGITDTVKGPLLFDDEAAAAVLAFYESRGRKRIAGDWEHDSMVPAGERPPNYRGSPASHWFEPQVRPGPELWAVNVKWTPDAFEQIRKGEYAHTSPVVKFQKATGRIVAVLSSALTNDPATIGQPQLVAATAESTQPLAAAPTSTEKPMPKFKLSADHSMRLKALADAEHESPEHAAGAFKACLAESMPEHFGEKKEPDGDEAAQKLDVDPSNLPQNAAVHIKTGATHSEPGSVSHNSAIPDTEKRAMTAWFNDRGSLFREVEALTGKKTRPEMVATLTAMKHASEEVATLTAKIATVTGSAFDAAIEKGKKDMKLTPADTAPGSSTKAGKYIASLRSKGDEGVMALTAYVDALSARATTDATATKEAETADLSTVRLSAAEVEACDKNGIDKVAYLANKKKRHADGDAPRFDAPR